MIYELLTGLPLFAVANGQGINGRNDCNDDHLLQLTDALGPLPKQLYARWSRSSKYFRADGEMFNSMVNGPPKISSSGSLENQLKINKSDEIAEEEERVVLDLLLYVLRYEPRERPSAEEILKHPWFGSEI